MIKKQEKQKKQPQKKDYPIKKIIFLNGKGKGKDKDDNEDVIVYCGSYTLVLDGNEFFDAQCVSINIGDKEIAHGIIKENDLNKLIRQLKAIGIDALKSIPLIS